MTVSVDEITAPSVTPQHRLCASKPEREWRTSGRSDTSPHCGFMVANVSWKSPSDSLIAWRRGLALSLICFCFFFPPPSLSRSLSCHMVKVEPVAGNDKQATRGGWGPGERGRRVGGWMDGGRDTGRRRRGGGGRENDTKEGLSHSLRCWNIKVSSQVVIFLRKLREEGG